MASSPGPWRHKDGVIIDANGDVVLAFVREANAPLLAAAPELLARLSHLVRFGLVPGPEDGELVSRLQPPHPQGERR